MSNKVSHVGPAAAWLAVLLAASTAQAAPAGLVKLELEPQVAFIQGDGGSHTLLFTGVYADGSRRDVTAEVSVEIDNPSVVKQMSPGIFEAAGLGFAKVTGRLGERTVEGVIVVQPRRNIELDFGTDVAPVFSKYGCNNTNCHGALNGQAGFKLSLFGYDPEADYHAVVEASGGRRVNREKAAESLLIAKPSFQKPHGGGLLIAKDTADYQTLLRWIEEGAKKKAVRSARLERIEIFPQGLQILAGTGTSQQILVIGYFDDGSREDLTRKVRYTSDNEEIAKVTAEGKVTAQRLGETTVLVRTLGQASALRVAVASEEPVNARKHEPANFIDELVFGKLARMNIEPSALSTDGEFIRRVYLDVLGIVPAPEETAAFLADTASDKRARLIDRVLERRREFADYWALKYGDLFANNVLNVVDGTAYLQDWLRRSLHDNLPYDRFVTEILTATGSTWEVGAVNYHTRVPEDVVTLTAQAFFGMNLECARCHDHPSDKWKREDFLRMAAFFSQVEGKGMRPPPTESIVKLVYDKEYYHPETKQVVKPRFLDGSEPLIRPLEDRRAVLARWLTSPENPWFARAAVNRFWAQLLGRGLVDPPDDFRVSNPPTNPDLLDRLAKDFVEHGYDLKHLFRTILNSKTYQLSSLPAPTNRGDETSYSRYYIRRLTAEQLMDSIVNITGVPQDFMAYYPGARSVNVADPGVPSMFLDMFDRSKRDAAKCERTESVSLRQAMHMLVGDTVNEKVKISAEKGMLGRLLGEKRSDAEIIDRLFLAALSRNATPEERDHCLTLIGKAPAPEKGFQNVLWALLSTNEFQFNH